MSDRKCIICGATIPEGDVCRGCKEKFEPNADILNAAINKYPVEYDGIKYGCISAFVIRFRASFLCAIKEPYILQVELMSKRGCVVIADPKRVKIIKEDRK